MDWKNGSKPLSDASENNCIPYPNCKVKNTARQIMRTFCEIEHILSNLRDLISTQGQFTSSLVWFAKIRACEKQLSKLFLATYAAEVCFRQPEDESSNTNDLL